MNPDKKPHYEVVEPFDTNNDSLAGLNPWECFALGVEWDMFRQQLEAGKPFTALCLSNNARRLVAMAERHRRLVEDRPTLSPGWTEIWVGGYLAS